MTSAALSATRGAGDTVAIVGVYDDPSAASDLNTFRSAFALPACTAANGCFQQLNEQGEPAPLPAPESDWAEEQSMDIEAVSSLCPNCKIDLVEATAADAQDLQFAITPPSVPAPTRSRSAATASTRRIRSPTSAPRASRSWRRPVTTARYPAGEDAYPAALPYVTAVGGTTLAPSSSSSPTPRGVTETAWNGSGAGCDTQEQPLPYQPSDGCSGRMYADVSADGDPATGLTVYDSPAGGWFEGGGTSLAAPLVAAFEAVTGVDGSSPQWAYTDAAELNDPSTGTTGSCAGQLTLLCSAGRVRRSHRRRLHLWTDRHRRPGHRAPVLGPSANRTYTRRVSNSSASLLGGVYPNGQATTFYWQYGATVTYSSRTKGLSAGSGANPVVVTAHLTELKPGTRYHYRLVAVNPSGTTYGSDASFVTHGQRWARH